MAERKNQHFVPKWYQNPFSTVEGHIWVYNLATKDSKLKTINATCTENWFYDDDGTFEKSLDLLETQTSRIIKKVIENPNIDLISKDELSNLKSFILLQFTRTRDASLISKNFVDLFIANVIQPSMEIDESRKKEGQAFVDSLKKDHSKFFRYTIQYALDNSDVISNLRPLFIVNKTTIPFFSSCAPVVKNNIYHLKKKPLTGFASPGLQIFCPLTEKLILLLIHDDAYEITTNGKSIIEITKMSDVDSLNKLQILNSRLDLFLIEEKNLKYIRMLHNSIGKRRTEKKFFIEPSLRIPRSGGEYTEIEPFYLNGINYGFQFSFLKINRGYLERFKKYWLKKLDSSPIVRPDRFEKM
jgi:hypothetical protein